MPPMHTVVSNKGSSPSGLSRGNTRNITRKPSAEAEPADDSRAANGAESDQEGERRRGRNASKKTPFLRNQEKIWTAFETDVRIVAAIMIMIILSTISFIAETEKSNKHLSHIFTGIDTVAVLIFTVEYVIRFLSCPATVMPKWRFVTNPMNVVDLLAILPFYLALGGGGGSGSFSGMRAIRLVRVFRIFKFGRYSVGIQIFLGAVKNSLVSLSILGFLMLIAMILFSSLMYYSEFGTPEYIRKYSYDGADWKTDGPFSSIPSCFWWAIVTMTTVGYGDMVPVTKLGKVVASCSMVCGIVILALPISVLGSNFNKMVDAYAEETATLNSVDLDGSGFVDKDELRMWLVDQKKLGKLSQNTSVNVDTILQKYDQQKKGGLNKDEFLLMAAEVISDNDGPSPEVLNHELTKLDQLVKSCEKRMEAIELARNKIKDAGRVLAAQGLSNNIQDGIKAGIKQTPRVVLIMGAGLG